MVPFQLRDRQGAARSVAYLLLAAAPVTFLTGIVLPDEHPVGWLVTIAVVCLTLIAGGLVCLRRPDRVPRFWWRTAPFWATILIAALNIVSRDTSTGSQLFYLWPVLYSANFLDRRAIIVTLGLVSAGHGLTVFGLLGVAPAIADWVSVTVALTLTAVVVASLRGRNERLREVLEKQAFADPLTGVANRRSFDGELARSVAWAAAAEGSLALLTVDIDHFKSINDTWGHAVGDRALQAVATALRVVARREDDLVARLGGDEFAVLLRTDRAGARSAADEIRAALAATDGLPGGPPGLSIGVAALPDHAGTADELLAASDTALYAAKAGGRGRTAVADPPSPRRRGSRAGAAH